MRPLGYIAHRVYIRDRAASATRLNPSVLVGGCARPWTRELLSRLDDADGPSPVPVGTLLAVTPTFLATRTANGVRVSPRPEVAHRFHRHNRRGAVIPLDVWYRLEAMGDAALDASIVLELGVN